ncbi:MAG: hypothetical protein PHU25_11380 [Deltaproteobacteria bacterium]|nr:hypothetical protein [Deltaproteobacteria bacterium]
MLFAAVLALASACAAEIGDSCDYDVDCSSNLDRTCDGSQPGGYCLVIGCDPDGCPSEAVCVQFTTPCTEGTSDETCARIEPNRVRDYCLRHCGKDGDCRSGYECMSPDDLYAEIIDLDPSGSKICVPKPDA